MRLSAENERVSGDLCVSAPDVEVPLVGTQHPSQATTLSGQVQVAASGRFTCPPTINQSERPLEWTLPLREALLHF